MPNPPDKSALAAALKDARADYAAKWQVIDQELYELCRRRPSHRNFPDVYAKVAIVGRVYAAGIVRSSKAPGDREAAVANGITTLADQIDQGLTELTTGEAIAVLLRTWNSAYYRYHPDGAADYAVIENLIAKHEAWLSSAAERTITSLTTADEKPLFTIFSDFEAALGPVGAAKALHLLAPRFMPLWDRAIAAEYIGALGRVGTNSGRYLLFMRQCCEQSIAVGSDAAAAGNILKALDEYNYCAFSKKWIEL